MTWLDSQDQATVGRAMAEMAQPQHKAFMDYARGDARFALYLFCVDSIVSKALRGGLFDLADSDIWSAYDGGLTPREAALEAMYADDLAVLLSSRL